MKKKNPTILAVGCIIAFVMIFLILSITEPCANVQFGIDPKTAKLEGNWEALPASECISFQPPGSLTLDEFYEIEKARKTYQEKLEVANSKEAELEKLEKQVLLLEQNMKNDPDSAQLWIETLFAIDDIRQQLTGIYLDLYSSELQFKKTVEGTTILVTSNEEKEKIMKKLEDVNNPIIEVDQKVYTWTDKVYITIVDPISNLDPNELETVGTKLNSKIKIYTDSGNELSYSLQETNYDTGIFTGDIILTGFSTIDVNNDGKDESTLGETHGFGPSDGKLSVKGEDSIHVSYIINDEEKGSVSSLIRWNFPDLRFLENEYSINSNATIRLIEPDLNLNPEMIDSVFVTVIANTSDFVKEIELKESNQATGIFYGHITFSDSSNENENIMVIPGDEVGLFYTDMTPGIPVPPENIFPFVNIVKIKE